MGLGGFFWSSTEKLYLLQYKFLVRKGLLSNSCLCTWIGYLIDGHSATNCERDWLCLSARWCLVLSAPSHNHPFPFIKHVLYNRSSDYTWHNKDKERRSVLGEEVTQVKHSGQLPLRMVLFVFSTRTEFLCTRANILFSIGLNQDFLPHVIVRFDDGDHQQRNTFWWSDRCPSILGYGCPSDIKGFRYVSPNRCFIVIYRF